MESSLYAHPEDLRGEGIERVAEALSLLRSRPAGS
jgi:hypothetical protein